MTQNDNGPGPGRKYGETGVFTFGGKVVFGLKMSLPVTALALSARRPFWLEKHTGLKKYIADSGGSDKYQLWVSPIR